MRSACLPTSTSGAKAEHAGGYLSMGQDWPPHRSARARPCCWPSCRADVTPCSTWGRATGACSTWCWRSDPGRRASPPTSARPCSTPRAAASPTAPRSRWSPTTWARRCPPHHRRGPLRRGRLQLRHPPPHRPSASASSTARCSRRCGRAACSRTSSTSPHRRPGCTPASTSCSAATSPTRTRRTSRAPVDAQLGWLRRIGFVDVDCLWKWHEMALLMANRPEGHGATSAERLSLPDLTQRLGASPGVLTPETHPKRGGRAQAVAVAVGSQAERRGLVGVDGRRVAQRDADVVEALEEPLAGGLVEGEVDA